MASTSRRRRLAEIALVALFTGCAHRLPNGGEWAGELAVRPGSTLPREALHNSRSSRCSKSASSEPLASSSSSPVLDTWRSTAAVRRSLVSIARSTRSSSLRLRTAAILGLAACRALLVPASFVDHAVQISGAWDTSPHSRGLTRVTWPCSGWRRSRAASSFLDASVAWLSTAANLAAAGLCWVPAIAGRKIY